MKLLKITTMGLLISVVPGFPLFAADLSSSSAFDISELRPSVEEGNVGPWTGAYVGAHVGGLWGSGRTTYDDPNVANMYWVRNQRGDSVFTGGIQAGYNYQLDEIVYGLEADFSWNSSPRWKTSQTFTEVYPGAVVQTDTRARAGLDWFGTLRGRLGYAVSKELMFYGTFGAAFGQTTLNGQASTQLQPWGYALSSWGQNRSHTSFGWAGGFGAEYSFAENWSLKGEYLRIDLGAKTYANAAGETVRHRTTADIARVGLSYQFK